MRLFPSLLRLLVLLGLSLTASAQLESEFMKLFEQARSINDKSEMQRLVKKHYDEAIFTIVAINKEIGKRSNDLLEEQQAALAAAWRKALKSSFADDQYRLYSLTLKGAFKKSHQELLERYYPLMDSYREATQAKDEPRLTDIGGQLLSMGGSFEELGDLFHASVCYRDAGYCFDDSLYRRKGKGEYKLACDAWGKFVAAWGGLQLKGDAFEQAKIRFEQLEYEGYGDPSKGPEARAKAKAEANPEYQLKPINASFEVVSSISTVQRPVYIGDENYQMWPAIPLQKKGSSGKISTLQELSPVILRVSSAKAAIDVDGDGTGDVDIPLGGKITPVEFDLDGKKWAFLATIGLQRDNYQGNTDFNLGPTDDILQIYIAGAGSIVGMVGETPIRLIDDNVDGKYGSPPLAWGQLGTIPEYFQPDVDTLVIGSSKVGVPWSELTKIGENWYKLNANEENSDILVARADVEAGKINLKMKGVSADWVLIQGTGDLANCYYRIGKKAIEVPAGSYKLHSGQISKGKRRSMMKALMLPSPSMRTWTVEPGKSTTVELGGPFGFDFRVDQDDEQIVVRSSTICVTGKAGETYQRLWGCVAEPDVLVRKAGSKKGKSEATMKPVRNQMEIQNYGNDYNAFWFPQLLQGIRKDKKGQDYEVQLYQKKNKLFGKITSDWKD